MHGGHLIKSWSSTQTTIALSSGEAEYYGLVKAASQALGMRSMMNELNVETGIEIMSDSSAAIGISKRRGLGKMRQVEVCQLWLQEKVFRNEIQIHKVPGEVNLADALTQHVDSNGAVRHLKGTNQFHV